MAKTQRNKRMRMENKKLFREGQLCPHCGKRHLNLQEHIKRAHGIHCNICSKTFSHKQQWVHHMRDFHQQSETQAERDVKVHKIDAWLKNERTKGQSKKERQKARAQIPKAAGTVPAGRMDAAMDSDDDWIKPPEPLKCADCGAASPPEMVHLSKQGLTFTCSILGRPCACAPPSSHVLASAAAGSQGLHVPMGFGTAPTATMPSTAPMGIFGMQAAALAPTVPHPSASFLQAQQNALASAAAIPIGADDDEDL